MVARIDAVDPVVLDAVEGYGLRGILEYMGLRVNWLPIGRPQHLIDALGDQEWAAPHVIVSCHGDERGIVLEKLDPEVARDEPFTDRLTPDLARRYVGLAGTSGYCHPLQHRLHRYGPSLRGRWLRRVYRAGWPLRRRALLFAFASTTTPSAASRLSWLSSAPRGTTTTPGCSGSKPSPMSDWFDRAARIIRIQDWCLDDAVERLPQTTRPDLVWRCFGC